MDSSSEMNASETGLTGSGVRVDCRECRVQVQLRSCIYIKEKSGDEEVGEQMVLLSNCSSVGFFLS